MKKAIIIIILMIILAPYESSFGIEATDFEVGEFENPMHVGESHTISVTLYPADADSKVTYQSSNPQVAEVSAAGKLTAKQKGSTTITITADSVKKTYDLKVIVATQGITLSGKYFILKKGENVDIKAAVTPSDAEQKLTYKSTNSSIARVSSTGTVTGIKSGSASIIVSNGEFSESVTVIVNKNVYANSTTGENAAVPELVVDEKSLTEKIKSTASNRIDFYASELGLVDENALKALRETGKTLTIKTNRYDIILNGKDIVNCSNILRSRLSLKHTDEGTKVCVNEGKQLPGKIGISIKDSKIKEFKYVYLHDKSKDKYQLINAGKGSKIIVDIAGEYYLTYDKLFQFKIKPLYIILAVTALAATAAAYIFIRRRYWFW